MESNDTQAVKLIFLSGKLGGYRYSVERDVRIGRDASNDIVIPDPAVSLVHCQIAFENGRAWAKDLGSTNGVRVNGLRVISQELRDGDLLLIAKNSVRVDVIGGRGGKAAEATVAVPGKTAPPDSIFGSVSYLLKRKIADGGMGSVYEAEQFGAEGFIKTVAIKTILPSFVQKPSFVASFVGEARLVANLVHPNIVQIHQLGRHLGGYYIAMDYIDGVNLAAVMARLRTRAQVMPLELGLLIMRRVCGGLDYAHRKAGRDGKPLHLVHRDISPSNIMVSREGEVKITDFGVAKAAQFMEEDATYLVGTVEYMSPEQADCAPVDARSDLFSLGLVGFELLTGERVFRCRDGNLDAATARVKAARIPDPRTFVPDLPEEVAAILLRCLSKEPVDRFSSAAELGVALDRETGREGRRVGSDALASCLRSLSLP